MAALRAHVLRIFVKWETQPIMLPYIYLIASHQMKARRAGRRG